MATAERGAPSDDARGVDAVESTCVCHDCAVVVDLAIYVEQLAGFAGRSAEVPVVEQDDGESGVAERFRVRGQPVVSGAGESMRHDDARHVPFRRLRPVEVCGELLACRRNANILCDGHAPNLSL